MNKNACFFFSNIFGKITDILIILIFEECDIFSSFILPECKMICKHFGH